MGFGHSLVGFVEEGGGFPGLYPLKAKSRGASAYKIGAQVEARLKKRAAYRSGRIFGSGGRRSGYSRRERYCEDKTMHDAIRDATSIYLNPVHKRICASLSLSVSQTQALGRYSVGRK